MCIEENTLLAFVEGKLPSEHIARVETHLDACAACRHLLAEVARSLARGSTMPPQPEPP